MAAWPGRRSSAWPSRSSASRCCLGPGCENLETRRGDRGWPLGQEGDHRLVLPGARLQGAASEPAAKTSKLAAEIADGRLAKRAVIFQEFAFKRIVVAQGCFEKQLSSDLVLDDSSDCEDHIADDLEPLRSFGIRPLRCN
jgi:hypothetical protein